jgi:hypothetical protein
MAGLPAEVRFVPLEHFPEKWAPVFRRKCDKIKKPRALSDSIESESAPGDIEPDVARDPSAAQTMPS